MTHALFQKVDLDKLLPSVRADIEAFVVANGKPEPVTVYDPLHYYLMWNGIIGYTTTIAEIFQAQKEEN